MPALAESWAKVLSEIETHFYHTWDSRLCEAETDEIARVERLGLPGGMPGRIGIKVGNIMRSRRNQGQCLACEESQAEPLPTAPLASSCRALRSATTPGYGRRMDDGKVREVTATASVLTLLVLTVLLGAQGFAQTAPAGQAPRRRRHRRLRHNSPPRRSRSPAAARHRPGTRR